MVGDEGRGKEGERERGGMKGGRKTISNEN